MKDCNHLSFKASVAVGRILRDGAPEDSKPDRYCADVTINCAICGVAMRFIGLPAGLDLNGAATSADATEARLAIAPAGEVISVIDGAIHGFSIKRES